MRNYYLHLFTIIAVAFTLSSCKKDIQDFDFEYFDDFSGSKWVIVRYDNTLTNQSTLLQDTIHFISNESYQINDGPVREYHYRIFKPKNNEFQSQNPTPTLMLFNSSTFGGDYYANITRENLNDSELNNILFKRDQEHSVVAWLEKVE